MTNGWRETLAEIRDALQTAAFTRDDEPEAWKTAGFVEYQDWALSLRDKAHGLFVPLNLLQHKIELLDRMRLPLKVLSNPASYTTSQLIAAQNLAFELLAEYEKSIE